MLLPYNQLNNLIPQTHEAVLSTTPLFNNDKCIVYTVLYLYIYILTIMTHTGEMVLCSSGEHA